MFATIIVTKINRTLHTLNYYVISKKIYFFEYVLLSKTIDFRCHGEVGNVVCEMGRKYNLFDSATTKYNLFECRRSDGKMIEQDKSDKLGELCISIIELYKDELKEFSGSFGEFILNK